MELSESSGDTIVQWLRQQKKLIVFISLIASILWTYISITSGTKEEQRQEITLTVQPQYQIISQKDVLPYPKGTIFEEDMASYFYAVSPRMLVTYTVTVEGMESAMCGGTVDSIVTLQAVDDKTRIYWQYPYAKNQTQAFTLSKESSDPGKQLSFTSEGISLEIASAYDTTTQIANELLFQNGTLQIVFSAEVHIQGTIDNQTAEKRVSDNLTLTLQQTSFTVAKAQDNAAQITLAGSAASADGHPSVASVIMEHLIPVSLTLIFLLLSFILMLFDNRKQSNTETEYKKYREWITDGSVDISDQYLKVVVLKLEGLVDLAIDLNKRVIYDANQAKYFVLTEEAVYYYSPDSNFSISGSGTGLLNQ